MNKKKKELQLKILLSIENIEPGAGSKNFQFEGYTVDDIENILEIAYDEGLFKGIEAHSKDGKNWLQMRLTMAGMNIVEDYRNNLKSDILKAALDDGIGIAPIKSNAGIGELVTINKQKQFKGKEYIEVFRDLTDMGYLVHESGQRYRISLEGKNFLKGSISTKDEQPKTSDNIKNPQIKIFIIHGHDDHLKKEVQLLLSRAEIDDIVLHEQPDRGRTIIDKLIEETEGASYAIALLCPEDEIDDGTKRARQNVILEIGYFLGKLGKSKVRLIKKGDVDIPSDLRGILYTEYDEKGAWKTNILKEIQAVGIDINIDKTLRKL